MDRRDGAADVARSLRLCRGAVRRVLPAECDIEAVETARFLSQEAEDCAGEGRCGRAAGGRARDAEAADGCGQCTGAAPLCGCAAAVLFRPSRAWLDRARADGGTAVGPRPPPDQHQRGAVPAGSHGALPRGRVDHLGGNDPPVRRPRRPSSTRGKDVRRHRSCEVQCLHSDPRPPRPARMPHQARLSAVPGSSPGQALRSQSQSDRAVLALYETQGLVQQGVCDVRAVPKSLPRVPRASRRARR